MFHRFLLPSVTILALSSVSTPLLAQEMDAFAEPYREIELAASEMGTITSISTKEGDRVKAGQVIASLNDQVLVASLEMAQEAMTAQGKIMSASAELKLQRERHSKIRGLRERRHASQIEVDRAATQLEIAEAQFQAAIEEIRIKKIEFRRIQAQIDQRRIKSPINGIITLVKKDEGEFVSPTDPVVAKVVQLDPLLVVFSIPKEDARNLTKNQIVPVTFANANVQGTIEFVSPTADAQSATTRVKVRIPNPELELQSGDACRLAMFDSSDDETIASKTGTQTKPVSITKP